MEGNLENINIETAENNNYYVTYTQCVIQRGGGHPSWDFHPPCLPNSEILCTILYAANLD